MSRLPAEGDSAVPIQKRKTRSPLVRFLLMLIRRSHLYFGLLLVPWALLYGITAYLFNHPSHFSAVEQKAISASAIPSEWPTRDWVASKLAKQVVDALNGRFSEDDQNDSSILLNPAFQPRFEGTHVNCSFESEGKAHTLTIRLDGQRGTFRSQPVRVESRPQKVAFFEIAPLGSGNRTRDRGSSSEFSQSPNRDGERKELDSKTQPLILDESLKERLRDCVVQIAKHEGHTIEASKVRLVGVPDLTFAVTAKDVSWECRHSWLNGSLNTKPTNTTNNPDFSWRRFLLRLHTAHTYPEEFNARWFWAIVVDVMAFVMVFWGVSGLVMWWQIKATRPAGSIALVISLVSALALGIGMLRL